MLIILCLMMLICYYGIIIFSLKFCNVDFVKIFREERGKILFVLLVGTAFVFWQVSRQQWIYFWDFAETWQPTIVCEQTVFSEPFTAWKNLIFSINYRDYNNFLPMLMALLMHILGKSFLAYTMYVWIMFALPAIFLTAAAIKTAIEKFCEENVSCAAILLILFSIPLIEIPVMNGYANVAIMLQGIILWLMLLNLDDEKFQPLRLFLIAVLSILAVIQSRSAAYMIIGLFFGFTVYKIYLRGNIFMLIKKFFVIGIFGAGLMAILFFPFVEHVLTYNHGAAYSAYSVGHTLAIKIFAHILKGGLELYIIFFIGIIAGLRSKKFRPLTIFSTAWAAVTVILISRIQFMGMQHYYTMLIPFCAIVTVTILIALKKSKLRGGILIFLLALNFVQAYTNILPVKIADQKINFSYIPPVRNDIDELRNFIGEINTMCDEGNRKAYPLMSSGLYNATSFKQSGLPDTLDAAPKMMFTADIDLRDGFPINFFDADIIIISAPIQVHLLPQDQSVVWKISELVTSMPLARHFRFVKEISLYPTEKVSDCVTLKVYEKISPYEKSDIDFVENLFVNLYPNNPELFKDRFEKYKLENFND